jgi:microcystin degradation protein MlrC
LLAPLREAVAAGVTLRGVVLVLHGALVADGEDDADGATLAIARQIVGPRVPVIATVDLHVHTTVRMVKEADVLVFYHCYPHIDMFETGERAARVLEGMVQRGARPVSAFCKLNVHLPVERVNTQATAEQVAVGTFAAFPPHIRRVLGELEAMEWCLAAGLGTTQPWLDVTDLGFTFVIVADATVPGAVGLAEEKSAELARELWDSRDEFMPTADCDGADATTSGAPGDSTWLLQELLKFQWPSSRPALIPMVAPEVVALATHVGVGNRFSSTIGGRRDTKYAEPLLITAAVEKLFKVSSPELYHVF